MSKKSRVCFVCIRSNRVRTEPYPGYFTIFLLYEVSSVRSWHSTRGTGMPFSSTRVLVRVRVRIYYIRVPTRNFCTYISSTKSLAIFLSWMALSRHKLSAAALARYGRPSRSQGTSSSTIKRMPIARAALVSTIRLDARALQPHETW